MTREEPHHADTDKSATNNVFSDLPASSSILKTMVSGRFLKIILQI